MLQTEFLRSLHANYERILLEEKPEERKYQYCILSRGGIKGLLPCSLRYMNGSAYLYYDITSRQNVAQLYEKRTIGREWFKDFLWSLKQIELELARFLLDIQNILWYPEQVFQDLESSIFSFLYVPYYEGEDSFRGLLEFLIDHIDYEDERLVDCLYKMYDHYEKMGYDYLQSRIFEDAKALEEERSPMTEQREDGQPAEGQTMGGRAPEGRMPEGQTAESQAPTEAPFLREESPDMSRWESNRDGVEEKQERHGLLSLFDARKKRAKSEKDGYRRELQLTMSDAGSSAYRVAEEDGYVQEYGRTVYIAETEEQQEKHHRLYTAEGQILVQLDKASYTIGKKRGEVDVVLEDASISRMHARIVREQDAFYLEDLNSTNGTFKNGLRMQPYEKRKLEEQDEICLGKIVLIFR